MIELLKQHAGGYHPHNAKTILVKDDTARNLQTYIDRLNFQYQNYLDRIIALEEGGGGGPSTGGSLDVGTDFNDWYNKCIAVQDRDLDLHYLTPTRDPYLESRNFFYEIFDSQNRTQEIVNSIISGGNHNPLLEMSDLVDYLGSRNYFQETFDFQNRTQILNTSYIFSGVHQPEKEITSTQPYGESRNYFQEMFINQNRTQNIQDSYIFADVHQPEKYIYSSNPYTESRNFFGETFDTQNRSNLTYSGVSWAGFFGPLLTGGDFTAEPVVTIYPTATISYETIGTTVVATLVDPSEPISITNNMGSNTYTFTENGTFIFEFENSSGVPGSTTATVSSIVSGGSMYPAEILEVIEDYMGSSSPAIRFAGSSTVDVDTVFNILQGSTSYTNPWDSSDTTILHNLPVIYKDGEYLLLQGVTELEGRTTGLIHPGMTVILYVA